MSPSSQGSLQVCQKVREMALRSEVQVEGEGRERLIIEAEAPSGGETAKLAAYLELSWANCT